MPRADVAVVGNDREAVIACSRLRSQFVPAVEPADMDQPWVKEMKAVRDELTEIQRKAPDSHTALARMQAHVEQRLMPALDTLRAQAS